jgi:hypothetical protein
LGIRVDVYTNMEKKTLLPRKVLEIEGKLAYGEGFQSWNVIRLKKEFVDEFPQLKEKRSSFGYKLKFFRDIDELQKSIKQLDDRESMPVLMWLYREKGD